MKLSDNIQMFRKKMGISQEELAEKCSVSRQAVTKWEIGESVPALDKLVVLANIFDISLDELVGRTDVNLFNRLMKLVKELAADDIPTDIDDDVSAIVSRYLLFMNGLEIDATNILNGLQEIFLKDAL